MYTISKLTGNIYLNGVMIPLDDSTQEFQQYLIDKDIVGVQLIDATPEEIAEQVNQQKQELKKILKQQQYEELLPTDWYVVRLIETGIAIPEQILQQRQEIRNKYN
jgi:hypothetical protein